MRVLNSTPASPAAPVALADLHSCTLGELAYVFRTPDVYDPARARRLLTRQRVRRPSPFEFRMAGLGGLRAMAAAVSDDAEGERQAALLEEWYDLVEPVDEDSIDEPDFEARAAIVAEQEAIRTARRRELIGPVMAIEANLERHCPAYAELKADREFWDDVSRIDMVRLLLISAGGRLLPRDDDALVTQAEYKAIPPDHRIPLATFAFGLLAPGGPQRKN